MYRTRRRPGAPIVIVVIISGWGSIMFLRFLGHLGNLVLIRDSRDQIWMRMELFNDLLKLVKKQL